MAYVRKLKGSGNWQAAVRHPSGRRLTKTHPLKKYVERWAAEEETKIRRGEWVDPTGGKMTLAEWWEQWSSNRTVETATTDRNASQWRSHVKPAFGSAPIASITSWEVEAWVAKMVQGKTRTKGGKPDPIGPETVASSLRLLRQLLAHAVRHRLITSNPADLVKAPTPPKHVDRFLTYDEALRLLGAMSGQDRLFVDLLLHTGLRWSEAAGLKVFRIDLTRSVLTVVETLRRDGTEKDKPKSTASQRMVRIPPRLRLELSAHLAGRAPDSLVFLGRDGAPLSYTNWRRRVWVPALERAALDDPQPTPHDCRHTFGSWLAEAGWSVPDIAAILGHSTLRATERYVHPSASRFARTIDALDAGDAVKALEGPATLA